MPVASFVLGAVEWTPVDHKVRGPHRLLPVGDLHALDPEDHTAVCNGVAMVPDDGNRSFRAWDAGTCASCSEAVEPRAAPTPRV